MTTPILEVLRGFPGGFDGDVALRSASVRTAAHGSVHLDDQYVVFWLTDGDGTLYRGHDQVPLTIGSPVMLPTDRFSFRLRQSRQSLIAFRAGYLERVASDAHGTLPGPLVFDHPACVDRAAAEDWQRTVRSAASVLLGRAPATADDRADAHRRLALTALRSFGHRTRRSRNAVRPGEQHLQLALAFIDAAGGAPITTEEIAAAAGLSARGLQLSFRAHLGTTPLSYARDVRLGQVRRELLAARPGEVSVHEIALRWGFHHLGRFAASYQAQYGEYPRTTLGAVASVTDRTRT